MPQTEHLRVRVPVAVQVACLVTVQLPYLWSPVLGVVSVMVSPQTVQRRTRVPVAPQVAGLPTDQGP